VRIVIALATIVLLGACDEGTDGTTASTPFDTALPTTAAATTSVPANPTTVQVFFVDQEAFNVGTPPYVTPVERAVDVADPPRGALEALFAGPTQQEAADGLRLVASNASGVAALRIEGGTAHVTLAGGCSSGGSTLTVAESIVATLRQFPAVQSVKIYDPEGRTQSPDEPGDSIPECLEP
jgi:hypothetical protein